MTSPDHSHDKSPHGGRDLRSLSSEPLQPPHDQQAEQCLITAAMAEDTGAGIVLAGQCGVKPAAFYHTAHTVVWAALESLITDRSPVTLETLVCRMNETGDLEKIGGLTWLMEAIKGYVPSAQVSHYAELVVFYWRRRHTMRVAAELSEAAATLSDKKEFEELAGDFGRKLINLSSRAEIKTLGERIDAVSADLLQRNAGQQDRSGWIYTRMPLFDARCKPLNSAREDGLTVLGGASGDGKSALMRQWAYAALDARNEKNESRPQKVLYFNKETSTDGCIEQLAGLEAELDLLNPELYPLKVERFRLACVKMKEQWADRYLFCHQHTAAAPLITIEDLELRARQHAWTHGVPHLIVVDYLQLLGTSNRRVRSREEVVAQVSHTLQSLQRELGCCVLVAAQLNESGLREMRTIKRDANEKVIHRLPGPGDFRESQAIYHDADRVIAIYRPPVDSRDQEQTTPNILKPEQWLCQIKRRKGGTGFIKCRFEKPLTRFVELGDGGSSTHPDASSLSRHSPTGDGGTTGQTKRQFQTENKP